MLRHDGDKAISRRICRLVIITMLTILIIGVVNGVVLVIAEEGDAVVSVVVTGVLTVDAYSMVRVVGAVVFGENSRYRNVPPH